MAEIVRRKTTTEQDHRIRQQLQAGATWREITQEYGITAPAVSRIIKGPREPRPGQEATGEAVMTENRCPRCGGADGAHYAGCILQNLLQRWLGPEYPLSAPPAPPAPAGPPGLQRYEIEEITKMVVSPLIDHIAGMRAELDAALEIITHPGEPRHDPLSDEFVRATFDNGPPKEKSEPASKRRKTPEELSVALSERSRRMNADLVERARPAVERVIAEKMIADPDGWVTSSEIADVVQRTNPTITVRDVGMVLTQAGYKKMQRKVADGSMPIHYRGLAWKPADPEPPLDEQMEKRRQAEAAAKKALPEPPARKERYRYEGQRPGQEISAEYRELLEPLWETPGWSYAPNNPNGGGKPRVTNPEGTSYIIPNTPSDFRAVKNTRAALRRLGAPL